MGEAPSLERATHARTSGERDKEHEARRSRVSATQCRISQGRAERTADIVLEGRLGAVVLFDITPAPGAKVVAMVGSHNVEVTLGGEVGSSHWGERGVRVSWEREGSFKQLTTGLEVAPESDKEAKGVEVAVPATKDVSEAIRHGCIET